MPTLAGPGASAGRGHALDSDLVSEPAADVSIARLTRQQVADLAGLARLQVTPAELDMFAGQLDAILEAVARVGEVAAADVPATSHAVPLDNVFRDDVVTPSLPRTAVLAGAPDVQEGRFRVPRIVSDEQ